MLQKQSSKPNEFQIAETVKKFMFKIDNFGSEYDHEKKINVEEPIESKKQNILNPELLFLPLQFRYYKRRCEGIEVKSRYIVSSKLAA